MGPEPRDPDLELVEIVKKAASLAKLSERVVTNAVVSFAAAAIAALADEEVREKVKPLFEHPEFAERMTLGTLRAVAEANKELEEPSEVEENPLSKEIATILRDRLGDTMSAVKEEELTDVARIVLDRVKKLGRATVLELSDKTGYSIVEVANAINELKRAGLVEVEGEVVKPVNPE